LQGESGIRAFTLSSSERMRMKDWTDEKVWKKANPSLGITVDIEKTSTCLQQRPRQNPAEENIFRQLRLQSMGEAVCPLDAEWKKWSLQLSRPAKQSFSGRVLLTPA